ncbi:MAG: ZIP family metal transporter [Bacilli bacterium]|nr:ZIP family metal transporter [Bacilli bacterium]
MNIILVILIPFLGTTLGSGMVFFLKDKINNKLEKFMLGLASGVMIAASIWSLLLPALEMTTNSKTVDWIPTSIGFILGVTFLLLLDYIIPHKHQGIKKEEGLKSKISKNTKLFLAVTIHNIPEGMAVGVLLSSALLSNKSSELISALVLSIGVAVQNFPEGTIISMPLRVAGQTRKKSFLYGVFSGAVEPIATLLTIAFASLVVSFMPYFLSFAAGAMMFVVIEELIPDTHQSDHSNASVIGFTLGFLLMMILDIILK